MNCDWLLSSQSEQHYVWFMNIQALKSRSAAQTNTKQCGSHNTQGKEETLLPYLQSICLFYIYEVFQGLVHFHDNFVNV